MTTIDRPSEDWLLRGINGCPDNLISQVAVGIEGGLLTRPRSDAWYKSLRQLSSDLVKGETPEAATSKDLDIAQGLINELTRRY
ncbi:MAG: hypothetical protein RI928_1682 [Pseudomonadota bacterium]|jgi:hypothetical protein